MDIKDCTVEQLKAMCYDRLVAIAQLQQEVAALEAELRTRAVEEAEPCGAQ